MCPINTSSDARADERGVLAQLQTLPGMHLIGAARLLVEIGTDMGMFGGADRLTSWGGIGSGNRESAGRRKSDMLRKGILHVQCLPCEFAHAARAAPPPSSSRRSRRSSSGEVINDAPSLSPTSRCVPCSSFSNRAWPRQHDRLRPFRCNATRLDGSMGRLDSASLRQRGLEFLALDLDGSKSSHYPQVAHRA